MTQRNRRNLAAAFFLLKEAALKEDVKLSPSQQRAIEKIKRQRALAIAHGMGTGKTVTSVGAVEALRDLGHAEKALVITPASLKSNYAEHGVRKFTDRKVQVIDKGDTAIDPKADYVVVSSSIFAKNPEKFRGFDTFVVDEAHHARNPRTNLYKALEKIAPETRNRILLTASPFNNSPADLAPLINVLRARREYDPDEFNKRYIREIRKRTGFLGLGRKGTAREQFTPDAKLKKDLQELFDYDPGSQKLPKVNYQTVRVPMTKEQLKAYRYEWGRLPRVVRWAVRHDILPAKRDTSNFFASLANARIASNDPAAILKRHRGPWSSAKVNYLVEQLQNRPEKGLGDFIYSNYDRHGAQVIREALRQKGIRTSGISGSMNRRQKDEQIEAFKKGKSDAFIATPTGKEGVSLPNVRREFIFDPHWNPEQTRQAIGRGVRADSISDVVDVQKLLAVEPRKRLLGIIPRKPPQSVEEWIHSVADKKTDLQKQVLEYLGR